jgi:hypothetical protein
MLYLIVAISFACFLVFVSAPFFRPRYLENLLFLVSAPLVLALGIGSMVFFASSNLSLHLDEHSVYAYPFDVVALGYSALGIFSISVLILPCKYALSGYFRKDSDALEILESINAFVRNRSLVVILSFISLLFLLPLWVSTGFSSSGFGALFLDPLHHYELREASIKYANDDLPLALYGIGVELSSLSVSLICAQVAFRRHRRLPLLILIAVMIVASNINGSRGGFFQPVIVYLISWVISLSQTPFNPLASFPYRLRLLINLQFSRKLFFDITRLFLVFFAIFAAALFFSFISIGREFSLDLINALFGSVFSRMFSAPFYSGLISIFASNELGFPFSRYFGGFPGASLLSESTEPYFISIGKFYVSYFRPESIFTPNLNSSGLFLNVSFFSFAGIPLFVFYLLVNIWTARVVCSVFASRYRANPYFLCLSSSWVLAYMSWNAVSSVIYVFPWTWLILSVVLYFLPFFSNNRALSQATPY